MQGTQNDKPMKFDGYKVLNKKPLEAYFSHCTNTIIGLGFKFGLDPL